MTTMCVRHIDTIVIVQLVSILTDTYTSPKLISKHVLHYDIQGLLRNMKIKKIDFLFLVCRVRICHQYH